MKISELIKRLQYIKKIEGDITFLIDDSPYPTELCEPGEDEILVTDVLGVHQKNGSVWYYSDLNDIGLQLNPNSELMRAIII